MSEHAEPVIVGQGSVASLRELRELLRCSGIHSEMVRPPEGRGSS